ncbi:hypothetical protein D3C83_168810 [compost metagenome]
MTTIEVIDPKTKRVVVRTTLDSYVGGVLADGSVWTPVNDADGRRSVRIMQLTLNR